MFKLYTKSQELKSEGVHLIYFVLSIITLAIYSSSTAVCIYNNLFSSRGALYSQHDRSFFMFLIKYQIEFQCRGRRLSFAYAYQHLSFGYAYASHQFIEHATRF
jgi:hypothetical protein